MRPLGIMRDDTFPKPGGFEKLTTMAVGSFRTSHRAACSLPIRKPGLWHAEHPILYEVQVDLLVDGKLKQTVSDRFGFRKIEVRGNQVFVNGKTVKLRGVCRHVVHPLYGRAIPRELTVEDVRLFREANCNMIRTSHCYRAL